MYKRATYATNTGVYQRSALPREQKKFKSLQFYRKQLLNPSKKQKYIKNRKLYRLNILNVKLHLSLFSIKNKKTAKKHFKTANRNATTLPRFAQETKKLVTRVDVLLLLLGIASTTY